MTQTRRLAAIMFTDIVGYTKLMQQSESSAIETRTKHRAIFDSSTANYDGEIIQYYGDGTLSIFNSTVSAVRCAVEMQLQFVNEAQIPVRIGLQTGDIIISESEIIGDSVNLASRVESLAVPGSVLIAEKVMEEIKNQDDLPVKFLGKFHFKNDDKERGIYALAVPGLVIPKREELKGKLEKDGKKGRFRISKLSAALSAVTLAVIVLAGWLIQRQKNIQWARFEAMPQIEELVESSWRDYTEAYNLAMETEKFIPNDKRLQELTLLSSFQIDINTDPQGADVFVKQYDKPEDPWKLLGQTPLEKVRLPKGFMRWKIEKENYEPVFAVESTFGLGALGNLDKLSMIAPNHFFRKLDTLGSIPGGMSRVIGGTTIKGNALEDFFIDRYEVTNRAFKEFIIAGGYGDQKYWKNKFLYDGQELRWEEAMKLFVDQTGRPGPATWEAGDYPDNQENHPVGGICWYEAAAFAEYKGKSLPTVDHWGLARGESNFIIQWPQFGGNAIFTPFFNYGSRQSVEVGSLNGLTTYGAYDMGGNVKEWCWNDTEFGKSLRGGAWNNNSYSFATLIQAPSFDRSNTNGVRCALYPNIDSIPEIAFGLESMDFWTTDFDLNPVSDEIYDVYRQIYEYDMAELNSEVITIDTTHEDWIEQKVMFDAAYDGERMAGYLFLPTQSVAPYQVVIYMPGSASLFEQNSNNLTEYYEFPVFLDFIVKTGRAVLFPIYKGTFERKGNTQVFLGGKNLTYEYVDVFSKVVKDFRRCMDYLENREDIAKDEIAFYGMSWGGAMGPIISAVERRIKTNIFLSGGITAKVRPEAMTVNYLPRVTSPTIMLNGRYDSILPYEINVKPMFDLLGTSDEDKKLVLFESDHIPPRKEMIKEILNWLDEYLGPVRRLKI